MVNTSSGTVVLDPELTWGLIIGHVALPGMFVFYSLTDAYRCCSSMPPEFIR